MTTEVRSTRSAGRREGASPTPWSVRLIERTGIEPLWLGLAAAVVLAALALGLEEAAGHVSRVLAGELPTIVIRAPVVAMLLIGLLPAGHAYLVRWTRQTLARIAPELAGSVPADPPSAHPSRIAGWIGIVSFVLLFTSPDEEIQDFLDTERWTLHNHYDLVMVSTLGWLMIRFMSSVIRDAVLVSRLGERVESIDLLDERSSDAFVQQGLQGALLVVLVFAVTSALAVSPGHRALGATLAMTFSTLTALAALLEPVRGVRKRIRAEKARQLATIRQRIDAQRRAVLDGPAEAKSIEALPALLALESRIESVREWPVDVSAWARFAVYMVLGLGSWVGAAAVERVLEWSLS